jgi:predicted PurR-regulated permease PerM
LTFDLSSRDITRTTLAVLFIGILIAATFWILRPFLTATIWATMIVVTTWPLMLSLQKRLWGRRGLAVTVMTVTLLLLFITPFTFAIISIIGRADDIVSWAQSLAHIALPPPPAWIEHLPLAGPKIVARWNEIAAIPPAELSGRLAPHARKVIGWLVAQAGSVGMMIVQFLLTVIISAVLYTVRGVALGVVVTALIQSLLAAAGLALAGVPAVTLLTAAIFILCVAQVGPGLVLIPVVIWLYMQDQTLWGSIMVVWTIIVGTIDNFIRPILIKKGADLPLLLIFAGVIGGLLSFGVIGLFIGPVLLAVSYTLLGVWISSGESGEEQSGLTERGAD